MHSFTTGNLFKAYFLAQHDNLVVKMIYSANKICFKNGGQECKHTRHKTLQEITVMILIIVMGNCSDEMYAAIQSKF